MKKIIAGIVLLLLVIIFPPLLGAAILMGIVGLAGWAFSSLTGINDSEDKKENK